MPTSGSVVAVLGATLELVAIVEVVTGELAAVPPGIVPKLGAEEL